MAFLMDFAAFTGLILKREPGNEVPSRVYNSWVPFIHVEQFCMEDGIIDFCKLL